MKVTKVSVAFKQVNKDLVELIGDWGLVHQCLELILLEGLKLVPQEGLSCSVQELSLILNHLRLGVKDKTRRSFFPKFYRQVSEVLGPFHSLPNSFELDAQFSVIDTFRLKLLAFDLSVTWFPIHALV